MWLEPPCVWQIYREHKAMFPSSEEFYLKGKVYEAEHSLPI